MCYKFLTIGTKTPQQIFVLLQSEEPWKPRNNESKKSCETDQDLLIDDPGAINDSSDAESIDDEIEVSEANKVKSSELSVTDPLTLTSSSSESTNENWNHFQIKWPLAGEPNWTELNAGSRDKQVIKTLVQNIVSQLKLYSHNISSEAFRIVAKQMANKFPKTFADYFEEGIPFRKGYALIKRKLKERYYT